MLNTKSKFTAVAALALISGLALTGCSNGNSMNEPNTEPMNNTPSASESETPMSMAGNLVGPGCEDYANAVPDGAGSVEGMSLDPVATAASNNPLLTNLTAAISGELNPEVNLVDTLNNGEWTVFAPVDEAFGKVDPATIDTLKTDADLLTSVLIYHVVQGQLSPDEVVGTHSTVQGADLTVTGEGDNLTVNGNAAVICGGVETANATVYLIDTVLMPPATTEQ